MTNVDLYAVADELRNLRPDLPHGIRITVQNKTRNLLVANGDLGFAITYEAIRDGIYLDQFNPAVDHLIKLLDDGEHLHKPELFTLERR